MKTDETIRNEWAALEKENIEKACEYLRKHESDIEDYIADCVAALCDTNVNDMLSDSFILRLAQPRWLYWYAIRYMTNETYERIAIRTQKKCGIAFAPNGIGQSINRMADLIKKEPIWMKRWAIIKHIIKLRSTTAIDNDDVVTIRVTAPKGIKVELKTE